MADSLNKASVAAIQAYHMDHIEGFYEKTFAMPMLKNFMGVTAKDKLLIRSATADSGLQSYQPGHHAKGTVTFTGRKLEMQLVKDDRKIETRVMSTDDYDSYLVRSGNNPRDLPYEAYVIELIYKALYESFTQSVLWGGKKLALIPGAPNNASDTADGFRELMLVETVAGNLPRYITGLATSTNAVDLATDFVEANLDTVEKNRRPHVLYSSLAFLNMYRKAYRDQHGSDTMARDANGLSVVHDHENVVILPQDGLSGSQLVISRPDNFYVAFDGAPFQEMRYESRELFIEIDWKYGLQYASNMELYPNEWI